MKSIFRNPVLVAVVSALVLVACAGLNRNLYHAEELSVDTVTGTVHTLNLWYKNATNAPGANVMQISNQVAKVHADVRKFYVVVSTVDQLRLEYSTNSASTNLTALTAGLKTLADQSSNIVWAADYLINNTGFTPLP